MADIDIQRKKSSPSPWLLILLVLLALAVAGYFLFRRDTAAPPTEPATPAVGAIAVPSADSLADATPSAADEAAVADMATDEAPVSADDLEAYATAQGTAPDYTRRGLQMLTTALVDLADRDDLRDPAVSEKRDQLTSATSRLDEPTVNLRPGFVAAAALLQAMQQKAYPELERTVGALTIQARQLSGPLDAPEARDEVQSFFVRAAEILRALNQPPTT